MIHVSSGEGIKGSGRSGKGLEQMSIKEDGAVAQADCQVRKVSRQSNTGDLSRSKPCLLDNDRVLLTGCGLCPCCIRTFRNNTGPPPAFFFSSLVKSQIFNTGYRLPSSSPTATSSPPASTRAVPRPLSSHALKLRVGTKCRSRMTMSVPEERMREGTRGDRGEVVVTMTGARRS